MARNEFVCDCSVIHQDVVDKTIKNMPDSDLINLQNFLKFLEIQLE